MSLKVAVLFSILVPLFFSNSRLSIIFYCFLLKFAVTEFNNFKAIKERRDSQEKKMLLLMMIMMIFEIRRVVKH